MLVVIETNYVVHLVLVKLIIIIGISPQFVQFIVLCCLYICTQSKVVKLLDYCLLDCPSLFFLV